MWAKLWVQITAAEVFFSEEGCFSCFLGGGRDTASLVFADGFVPGSGRLRQCRSWFHSRQHPEVVRQHLPVHRQFPMFKSFGPHRPAQKSVLEYPNTSFGLAAPPLQLPKTCFGHSLFESRRGLGTYPVVNVPGLEQRLVGRAAETPVRAQRPDHSDTV